MLPRKWDSSITKVSSMRDSAARRPDSAGVALDSSSSSPAAKASRAKT